MSSDRLPDEPGDLPPHGVKLAVLAVAVVVLAFIAGWKVVARLVLAERSGL